MSRTRAPILESPGPYHRLAPEEVPRAVEILARAFASDPFVDWVVRSDAKREDGLRRFFTVCLRQLTMPFGEVWATGGLEGVALWTPPGKFRVGPVAQARFLWQAIWTMGLTNVSSRIAGFNEIERHTPPAPHYYLFFIGIDPSRQGEGIGSLMLGHMLGRCDTEGMSAYLEATRVELVPLYEHYGYEALQPIAVPHRGPTLYPMWRDPVGCAESGCRLPRRTGPAPDTGTAPHSRLSGHGQHVSDRDPEAVDWRRGYPGRRSTCTSDDVGGPGSRVGGHHLERSCARRHPPSSGT